MTISGPRSINSERSDRLFVRAEAFWKFSQLARTTLPEKLEGYSTRHHEESLVFAYNATFAVELFLKCAIMRSGGKITDLLNINHKLSEMVKRLETAGYPLPEKWTNVLKEIEPYYGSTGFRYPELKNDKWEVRLIEPEGFDELIEVAKAVCLRTLFDSMGMNKISP